MPVSTTNTNWLVAKLKGGGPKAVHAQKEITRLLPFTTLLYFQFRERWGRSINQGALFPGYAFLRDKHNNKHIEAEIDHCHWFWGAVRICGDVCYVADKAIQPWLDRVDREGFIWLTDEVLGFPNETKVRVTAGPFAGCAGIVKGMSPKERVNVLIRFFNRPQRVMIPVEDLIAA